MRNSRFAAFVVTVAGLGAGASFASATTVASFDNPFALTQRYANWAPGPNSTATFTSNPTNYEIKATGYGSGYKNLGGVVDATGADTVQLDVTVNAGVAGFIIAIGDGEQDEFQYAWYGKTTTSGDETPGSPVNYILTMPISAGTQTMDTTGTGVLDLSQINEIHIGIDPGGGAGGITQYDVTFNDLSLVSANTPEPTTLAALGLAGTLVARRRR